MKKSLILALAAVLVLGISAVSFAGLSGSVHDLVGVDSITEICAVCHSPHDSGANRAADGPLWNHELSSLTFTQYVSTDPTAEVADGISGNSKLCLGCHDGVTALSAYGEEVPGSTVATTGKVPNLNGGSDGNLQGTHPISITYDGTKNGLNTSSGVTLGTNDLDDVLQNGKVECSTCHDVHNNTESLESTGTYLLRGTNAASALCTSCHFK
jgi:hypothetical protein